MAQNRLRVIRNKEGQEIGRQDLIDPWELSDMNDEDWGEPGSKFREDGCYKIDLFFTKSVDEKSATGDEKFSMRVGAQFQARLLKELASGDWPMYKTPHDFWRDAGQHRIRAMEVLKPGEELRQLRELLHTDGLNDTAFNKQMLMKDTVENTNKTFAFIVQNDDVEEWAKHLKVMLDAEKEREWWSETWRNRMKKDLNDWKVKLEWRMKHGQDGR